MVGGQESFATIIEVLVHAFIISFTTHSTSEGSTHFSDWLFLTSEAWHKLVGIFTGVHFQLIVLGFKFKL